MCSASIHVPPTQRLRLLQRRTPDLPPLQKLLEEFLTIFEPWQVAEKAETP